MDTMMALWQDILYRATSAGLRFCSPAATLRRRASDGQSTACRLLRFCCTGGAAGAFVRDLTQVGTWRSRPRIAVWVIAVVSISMAAFADSAAAQTPNVGASGESVTEGGEIAFSVSLSASSNRPVTVQYTTENGANPASRWNSISNARSGSDFTAASGTLSFAPGETRKTVRVSTTTDSLYEYDEIFYLRLSNPTNARFGPGADMRATGTIVDDDPPPTVNISDGSATEGGEVEFEVSLSAPTARSVSVHMTPEVGIGDTATLHGDFDDSESGLTFFNEREPPSFTVQVITVDDNIDEEDETFTARLSNPTGGLILGDAMATGTIIDNDDGTQPPSTGLPTVGFLGDPHGAAGDWIRFPVMLSKPSDRQVSVQYRTSSGTAQSEADFNPEAGVLVFEPGEVFGDMLVDTTERGGSDGGTKTFTMTLSNPANATLGDATATGTITELDTAVDGSPYVAVHTSTDAVEGDPVTFTVRLSAPSEQTVTVQYEAQGIQCVRGHDCGSAKSGVDYVATSGTLTFAPRQTEKRVSVSTTDDSEHEGTEELTLVLSNPTNAGFRLWWSNKEFEPVWARILDNDDATVTTPEISISAGAEVTEGSGATFTITASPAPAADLTVNVTVTESGGYATAGTQQVTVPTGGTTATLTVATVDDGTDEPDGSVTATLAAGTGYTVSSSRGAATVMVTDDDGPTSLARSVELTAAFEDVPEEHDGGGRLVLRVRFSEALGADGSAPSSKSFDVRNGRVNNVKQLGDGLWRVRVKPDSWRDVTVTLAGGRACGEAGAVCTADGRALSNSAEASVGGPVRIRIQDGKAREGKDAGIDFAVTLNRASSETVSVDYATADGSAKAGEDYEAVSGTLTFAAGETEKTVHVTVLDDDVDEGSEKFELRLSNESGAYVRRSHRQATGTIKNTDLIPAALLARFGRATAEQVVTHIEERMAAPRRRGFRARFAGRELRPGQEPDFALGLVSQFAQPRGMGPAGAVPMGMGSRAAGAGAFGVSTTGMSGGGGAMGMTGIGGMPGAMRGHGPAGGAFGGGLFDSMGMGGDLFSNSEFELNRESRGGMLSVWSSSSRSHFSGLENALSLDGDVRTTMFGADYSRGALTVGLSVGRTLGMGGYRGTSGGRMSTSMTGFYPWVGYQVSDRVSVWGVTGYGTGALSLTPDGRSALETGVSMAMSAVGTRGELIGARATGGFSLAFKADALWVGAASDLVDGAMGRLNASEAGVTRVRTALEGSRGFTLGGGRLSLTPSVEVGLRRDGGDAETGAGMDVGGGLAFTDTVTGLSLDVRVRTLVVHQAAGFSERGMSLSFGWDPTPSSPLGLTARVAPSWGGQAMGGAQALWGNQMAYGMGSHQMYGSGDRVDAEVGYGLPVGGRFVGTPRVGLATSQYGRDLRFGYGLGVLDRGQVSFELGVDAQRRESPMHGEASNGFLGRASLGW